MPLPRLIPCLDVAAGRVVKGVRFQNLRDMGDPVELGVAYSDAGADELVFLDVKATLEGRPALLALVARVADRLAIPFTVGGGVRSVADGASLLRAGADKISVNTAALDRPTLISELANLLGSQAVVVAIDAAEGKAMSRAGTDRRGRGCGLGAGDRVGRSGRRAPYCGRTRGCAGGPARVDLARTARPSVLTPAGAARVGGPVARCRLSCARQSSRMRTAAAC